MFTPRHYCRAVSDHGSCARRRAARVLVIEDDPDISSLEPRHLRALGHVIHVAGTGEAGLAAAAHQTPMAAVGFGPVADDGPEETS